MAAVPRAPARGTEADLRALFVDHFDFVWRSVRRLGVDAAAADDAAQEVFLVASRRLSEIE
jgi:RNA polymerase sigma-70 factor (ECF subfamily)